MSFEDEKKLKDESKEDHRSKDEYDDYLKIPRGQKLQDFDFYELTADISNSITDQIYRDYMPILERRYREEQKSVQDENIKNDLHVEDMVSKIRSSAEEKIQIQVSELIAKQVTSELKEQYHARRGSFESFTDKSIKALRWFMLPSFIVISVVMIFFSVVIVSEAYYMAYLSLDFVDHVFSSTTDSGAVKSSLNEVVAAILAILDLLLVGSLVVMVVVGGYENTISRIGMTHNVPTWFGKLDIAQLKIKVAASIIIISSIHLLMSFMQLDLLSKDGHNYNEIMWTTIVHAIFVLSGIGLAYMDVLQKGMKKSGV